MIYDCIIIGAGAAGATLAIQLRRANLNVALLEAQSTDDHHDGPADWITRPGLEQLDALEIPRTPWCGEPLHAACFHSRDLARKAVSRSDVAPAWRIDYAALVHSLLTTARQAGADLHRSICVDHVVTAEDGVRVLFPREDKPVQGKFVVYADGAAGALKRTNTQTTVWIAEAELDSGAEIADDTMHWALHADQPRIDAVMWWLQRKRLQLRVIVEKPRAEAVEHLCAWGRRLKAKQIVDAPADVPAASVRLRPAPHPPALEHDSHVGKRSLIIGDAGGFVSPFSHEGLFPAVWSAMLAAEAIRKAVRDDHPQDALRGFSTLWRTAMGAFLRPPNTDMQFLLPLIFTNQQMTDRLASAFWTGDNI